jgi:hypothetical protein
MSEFPEEDENTEPGLAAGPPEDDELAPGDVTGGAKINPFEDPDAKYEEEEAPPEVTRFTILLGALAIVALLLFNAWQIASWNKRETRPPSWDQAIQLEITHDTFQAVKKGEFKELFNFKPKPGMPPFPPVYHFTILYSMLSDNPVAAARWGNLLYLAILCFSLYGMSVRLGGVWPSVAATVMLACAPEVQWLLRDSLVDLALTAWVAAAYWALWESEKFNWRRPSIAFGVLFGLAMLTKWSAWTYFLPIVWWALEATNERLRTKNLLLAVGAALLICGPWYAVQWSVVLPRLFSASADNAVSISTLNGLLSYPGQMMLGFEFPLFVFCAICFGRITASQRTRTDTEMFITWFLTGLVFWTLVPNRQLRYLLPALTPLFVFIAMSGKRNGLIAMSLYMVVAACNYSYGFLKHRAPRLGFTISFFKNDVPKAEAWPLEEILRWADAHRQKGRPFSNLSLLANHPQFNGATFNWVLDRHEISGIKMRGVNKRVCEFSEFLVLKTSSLGPKTVINQLPEVRRRLMVGNSWFTRGYREAKRWDLPDGSHAVIYQRRKMSKPILPKGTARFDYFEDGGLKIVGASIQLGSFDRKRGFYPSVRIRAKTLGIRGLNIENIDVTLEELNLVTVADPEQERSRDSMLLDVRLLDMKRLTINSAQVTAGAAAQFLGKRVKGLRAAKFKIDEGVSAKANVHGMRVAASVAVALLEDSLDIQLKSLSVAGVPISPLLLGPNAGYRLSLAPDPELPFELRIGSISTPKGVLRIGT